MSSEPYTPLAPAGGRLSAASRAVHFLATEVECVATCGRKSGDSVRAVSRTAHDCSQPAGQRRADSGAVLHQTADTEAPKEDWM